MCEADGAWCRYANAARAKVWRTFSRRRSAARDSAQSRSPGYPGATAPRWRPAAADRRAGSISGRRAGTAPAAAIPSSIGPCVRRQKRQAADHVQHGAAPWPRRGDRSTGLDRPPDQRRESLVRYFGRAVGMAARAGARGLARLKPVPIDRGAMMKPVALKPVDLCQLSGWPMSRPRSPEP